MRKYIAITTVLIVFLFITALMGFFGKGVYDYWSPVEYVQESIAQDLITLVLGIPLLIIAIFAVSRKRYSGIPLWIGVLAYELYVYLIYSFGGVYNYLFPAYIAVSSLSLYIIIGLFKNINLCSFSDSIKKNLTRLLIAVFFVFIVIVFGVIWLSQIIESIISKQIPQGHLIFVIDLMIVLPAFGIAAVKLLKKNSFGNLLAGVLLIKFDSLCISIALGQIFRYLNKIEIEASLFFVFIPLGLISLFLTTLYFKGFCRTEKRRESL